MKYFFVLAIIFSSYVRASEFNGYIVKYKKVLEESSFLGQPFTIQKKIKTSFGNYAKVIAPASFTGDPLKSLRLNPNVVYAEPNWIIKLSSIDIPADASFKKQWGLKNTGISGGKIGEDINILKAWEISKGSKDVKIAVIDTGVDYTHPDLKNQIEINLAELNGKPGVDDDGNGYVDDVYGYNFATKNADPMDGHGHGTHCAGVIGAEHNQIGVAGVMSQVKIIPVKFLSDSGEGEELDAIAAIDYAIKRGAKVLSNSWGGSEKTQALEDAIVKAEQDRVVFVAAAGNEYSDNDSSNSFPANFDISNVISVGAFTNKGSKASFSNYGAHSVHVFAPGQDIYSTVNKGGYASMSGTSMATPYVSGVVGLLLSKEPNLSPQEVRERLIKTSHDNSKLNGLSQSNGRIDAYSALMNQ
jgi:thermitase